MLKSLLTKPNLLSSEFNTVPNRLRKPIGSRILCCVAVLGLMQVAIGSAAAENKIEEEAMRHSGKAQVACDNEAESHVKNPSSFDSDWFASYVGVKGQIVIVFNNFRAMNGFGALLDHYYICNYDYVQKTITAFEIREGRDQ